MHRARSMRLGCLLAAALAGCQGRAPSATTAEAPGAEAPAAPASPAAMAEAADLPGGIAVADARVELPAVPGRPGVAYLTVSQSSGPPRTIAAVTVAGAGRSEMHTSMSDGGVSRMAPLAALALVPGRTLRFAPGGHHVMLFDLDPAVLAAGGNTRLTVEFADGERASVSAPVSRQGSGNRGGGR